MQYDEFILNLRKAGLSIKAFATLIGMNRVSISNMSQKGIVPVHLAVIAALMREMTDKGVTYASVLAQIKIEPRPAKGIAARGVFGGTKPKSMPNRDNACNKCS